MAQDVASVTGACLLVRRDMYAAAGGMNEHHFAVGLNDIDFGLRIRNDLGRRIIWTPHVRPVHKGMASRSRRTVPEEAAQKSYEQGCFDSYWFDVALDDPAASPDVRNRDVPVLAGPPRGHAVAGSRRLRLCHRPIIFTHIPKTAGVSLRERLSAEYLGNTLYALSARTMMRCYDGDRAALTAAKNRLANAGIALTHVAHGFGALLGVDCAYATVLRDPTARALAHREHLAAAATSPVHDTWLAEAPIDEWFRRGALRGNLMLRRILGERPESVGWSGFQDGAFPHSPHFCGFRLPPEVWAGRAEALRSAPEIPPEEDTALLARALDILHRDFCFVGRQEALDAHIAALGAALQWRTCEPPAQLNQAREQPTPLDQAQLAIVEDYNKLDRALLSYIEALPGGFLLQPHLVYGGPHQG